MAVHNEILRRRPDLAPVMAAPWYMDRKGEVPEGKQPYFQIPIFNYFKASAAPLLKLCLHTFVMPVCQGCSHMPEHALPIYNMKAVLGFQADCLVLVADTDLGYWCRVV